MIRRPPRSTLFPTRRSSDLTDLPEHGPLLMSSEPRLLPKAAIHAAEVRDLILRPVFDPEDRKSTRLNSSHSQISYAVFCLKKKKKKKNTRIDKTKSTHRKRN